MDSGLQAGLSPRMRGNPTRIRSVGKPVRSIPAYAGEPPIHPSRRTISKVYPRVCGGTRRAGRRAGMLTGLSPRMRGNRSPGFPRAAPARSIPAYAGEPPCQNRQLPHSGVYPRVCGGTIAARVCSPHCDGLSPRMRGNPAGVRAAYSDTRSIPAYAGEPQCRHTPACRA